MHIILWIIIILIALGLIISLFEWIGKNFVTICIVAIVIIALIKWPKGTIVTLGILGVLAGLYMIVFHKIIPFTKEALYNSRQKSIRKKEEKQRKLLEKENEKQRKILEKENERKDKQIILNLPGEVQQYIRNGEQLIEQLEENKKNISSRRLLSNIDECVALVGKLLQILKKEPNKLNELNRVVDYYLPTVVKLTQKYYETYSENKEMQDSIISAVEQVSDAMSTLLKNLSSYDDMETQVDIALLEKIIELDGLSESKQSLTK